MTSQFLWVTQDLHFRVSPEAAPVLAKATVFPESPAERGSPPKFACCWQDLLPYWTVEPEAQLLASCWPKPPLRFLPCGLSIGPSMTLYCSWLQS
jgi:hypothetical protein